MGVDFNIPAGYEEIPDRQTHTEMNLKKWMEKHVQMIKIRRLLLG